jgi:hypothetical protein
MQNKEEVEEDGPEAVKEACEKDHEIATNYI